MINIHFVCTGNIFRSRLAEAYLKSKKFTDILISSSGTHAKTHHKGSISWYAQRLLFRYKLIPYMSKMWVETSAKLLLEANIIIFIDKSNYDYCQNAFGINTKYEIWNLIDFDDSDLNNKKLDLKKESEYIMLSEKIFQQIKDNVDKLIKKYLFE